MVTWMIDKYGNEAQRSHFIPALASMEKLGSYCLTEPNAGSDAASLATTARREGNKFIVNGTKVKYQEDFSFLDRMFSFV